MVKLACMRLLITGICGFVGSTLASALVEHDSSISIVGIDNFVRCGSWTNRQRLCARGINVIHGDIRLASDVDALPAVDFVIDAAAHASVLSGVAGGTTSRQLMENNLLGTVNLLEYCKRNRAGFLLLSTSRVYSIKPLAELATGVQESAFVPDLAALPNGIKASGITEVFSTRPPVSVYGATKLASELLALEYGHAFEFPVWINRCGVMAGAGQFGRPDQGIFAFWLHSWREKRQLAYIGFDGMGHQVRDCLQPRDMVPLILKQLQCRNDGREQIVNVSGGLGSACSLAQLSAWCARRWGKRQVMTDANPRPFDLPWVVLDHSLASQVWDWQPQVSLEHILSEIAEFADANPDWIALSR